MIKKIGNITMVGTSHVSKDSIKDIKKAIDEQNPEVITIELDKRRALALMTNNKKTNKLYIARKIGIFGLIFYSIAEYIQNKIGKGLGIEPGSDMLTAIKIAKDKKLPIALIDRDIEITMKRLGKNITWTDRKNFVKDLFSGIFYKKKIEKEFDFDLSKVPAQDLISQLIKMMKKRYPGIYKTLIHERNIIMANRLISISKKYEGNIVSIVGAGHVEGMMKILVKT